MQQPITGQSPIAVESERYSYGGVGFEILQASPGPWELGADHQWFLSRGAEPTCAQVRVAVAVDPSLDQDRSGRAIEWCWEGDHAHVRTVGVVAQLQRVSTGSYVAAARIGTTRSAESSLTTALAGIIVGREGGVVLHAAGIVIDDAAVLFIGPSGAGKTTACNHASAGSWHARDRAAIYSCGGSWWTWGMAGGDDIDLPRAERRAYRLASVMRVRRGEERVAINELTGVQALAALRESAQWGHSSPMEEGRLLDSCLALASAVPVVELRSVLQHDLSDLLHAWSPAGRGPSHRRMRSIP